MEVNDDSFKGIEDLVRNHPTVNHSFLRKFGDLDLNGFIRFIKEQYKLSTTLPYALAHTYGHAHDVSLPDLPNWQLAKPIVDFLKVEHWGSDEDGAHSSYFTELATALNIEDIHLHEQYRETQDFVNLRTRICRYGPFLKAVGTLAFANEYANKFIFEYYLAGARKIRERSEISFPLDYFDAHVRDEQKDYEQLCTIMAPLLEYNPSSEKLMVEGTCELLDARLAWYNALNERLLRK